jgi:RNA polymerase sigma factor (sigma-70 family)
MVLRVMPLNVLPPSEEAPSSLTPVNAEWSAAVERHSRRVLLTFLSFGIPYTRAQELTQEVWMRLVEGAQSNAFVPKSIPALALAQARFLALAELRRRRNSPEVAVDRLPEVAIESGLHNRFEHQADLRRIQQALRQESAINQRVFALAHGDAALPAAEVAREAGLSTQRVRQILSEVRQRLRIALEKL